MIDALSAAISGMKAAAGRTNIVANNIANLNTDNYKRKIAVQKDAPGGGVTLSVRTDNSPGYAISENPNTNQQAAEFSNVDIPTEFVNLIKAKHALKANISTIRTANENLGSILDIKA